MNWIEDKVEEFEEFGIYIDDEDVAPIIDYVEFVDNHGDKINLMDWLRTALKEAQEQERERIVSGVTKYFEKGLGFNKGSINDSMFQRLKSDLLEALSNKDN